MVIPAGANPIHVVLHGPDEPHGSGAGDWLLAILFLVTFVGMIGFILYTFIIFPFINLWSQIPPILKISSLLIIGGIIFGVISIVRGISRSVKRKRNPRKFGKKKGFWKFIDFNDNLFAWIFIFGFSFWLISKLLATNLISNLSPFVFLLFVGITISVIRWFMLTLLYGNRFIVDGWFIIWSLKSSIVYSLIIALFNYANFNVGFMYFILCGLIFHLATLTIRTKLLKNFRKKGFPRIVLIFFLLVGAYGASLLL